MKSTAQIIGLFGVIQLAVIAGAWQAARAFKKVYIASGFPASMMPDPGWGLFLADHGWLCLLLPVLWCAGMIWLSNSDSPPHMDTARVARISLVSVALVLFFFGGTSFQMMKAAMSRPQVPLTPLQSQ